MGSHPDKCPCSECAAIIAAIVAQLVGIPRDRRQSLVKRALAWSNPTAIVCPQCSGKPSPVICGTCGGIGRVEAAA